MTVGTKILVCIGVLTEGFFACRPGIALDHHLRPVIDNVESDLHVPGHSLNAVSRKHEQERIVVDNQHILQRICKSKGAYSGSVLCQA